MSHTWAPLTMIYLALLLAFATATACVWALRDARADLGQLTRADWLGLIGATVLGAVYSLAAFDAIDNHAFRAHEEQIFAIFQGQVARDSYHLVEVPLLIAWIFEQVGAHLGRSTALFVATALALGGGGPLLAGMAGRLATGRWLGGALPALLLALQPTLAYWRLHGYHVAPPQVLFSACLLAAVIVGRRGSRPAYTAWFLLGALTVFVRLEYATAVACTAALPLLAGRTADLRKPALWGPGLLVAALLFALPESQILAAMEQREDYRMGARFVAIHLPVLARLGVGALGGGLLLLALAAVGCVAGEHRRTTLGLLLVAATAVAAPLAFTEFGMRHTLGAATALYIAAGAGLVVVVDKHRAAGIVVAAVLLLALLVPWAGTTADLASRYGLRPEEPPELPGLEPPTSDPPAGWERCAVYSNVQSICDASPNCHPVKDMRDPVLVRRRWDQFDGCVYWTVDATFGEVAGGQHEWWPFVRALYSYEASGRVEIPDQGDVAAEAHLYRITERP